MSAAACSSFAIYRIIIIIAVIIIIIIFAYTFRVYEILAQTALAVFRLLRNVF